MRDDNNRKHTIPAHMQIPIEYMDSKGGNKHKISDRQGVERWLMDHKIPFETLEHKPM